METPGLRETIKMINSLLMDDVPFLKASCPRPAETTWEVGENA